MELSRLQATTAAIRREEAGTRDDRIVDDLHACMMDARIIRFIPVHGHAHAHTRMNASCMEAGKTCKPTSQIEFSLTCKIYRKQKHRSVECQSVSDTVSDKVTVMAQARNNRERGAGV